LTFIAFACKNNILLLIDRAGSLPVKRSIDLQLIREFPLFRCIWQKFLLQLSADGANKRVLLVGGKLSAPKANH